MTRQPTRTPRVRTRGVGRLLVFSVIALGAFLPMPTTSAAPTICVALVVDFTPLNGAVDSGCTRVPKGANGYDVLRAGGHTFQICANGVIGTIDGQPANGCRIKDSTHFWGYWHRKPGSRTWTFSNFGAGGYHPVEGSTEGWVWEDGKTSPPADTSYPVGCHSPPASASPTPRPSAHTSTNAPASHGGANNGARSATRKTSTTPTSSKPHRARRHASASPPDPKQSSSPAAVGTAPTPTSTAAVLSDPPPDPADDGRGPVAPLAAGVGLAALLGTGAWWRSRRNGVES